MLISGKRIVFFLTVLIVFAVNFNANAEVCGWHFSKLFDSEEQTAVRGGLNADGTVKPYHEINTRAILYNVLWYLPNCLLDLADCFTFEAGAGDFGIDLYMTRYATIGAGVGNSYNVGWTNKRQIGFFNDAAYNADFLFMSSYEKIRTPLLGTHKYLSVFNCTNADIIKYPPTMKHEDPYAIGAKFSCLLGFKFQFHPVEFADFITGLFFYDLNDDSKKRQVFRVIK